MVWVASFLLFLVVAGGLFGIVAFRNRLRDDGEGVRELPPDVLIALARANEARRSREASSADATGQPPQ
jgi:hypothetical protein